MPMIRKFMDLSTGHLKEDDKHYLDYAANQGKYAMSCGATEFGWFVYAPEDVTTYPGLPTNLARVLQYVREHGCDYALIESDVEEDMELPIFEEECT